jgi:hypothetical protein
LPALPAATAILYLRSQPAGRRRTARAAGRHGAGDARAVVAGAQARNTNHWEQFENRIAIIFKPIAVPAILGVSLTMLFFGVLLGSLASQATVMASDRVSEAPVYALYKPVRTTGPTMMRFAGSEKKDLQHEPVMIETQVSDDGKVLGYEIISGQATPEITRWVREMLSVAKFTPATAFGKPVVSKIILSFVAVRS